MSNFHRSIRHSVEFSSTNFKIYVDLKICRTKLDTMTNRTMKIAHLFLAYYYM